MKKALYTSVAFVLLGGSSLAADLTTPAIISSDSFDWSGFYVGVHGGLVRGTADAELSEVDGPLLELDVENGLFPRSISGHSLDGVFGAQAGYLMQFDNYVLGVEGDISWLGSSATGETTVIDPGTPLAPMFTGQQTITSFRTSLDGLATLRAKAGVTSDRTLFYVTGGLAAGNVENEFGVDIPGLGLTFGPWSDSGILWGFVLGAGVEHALTENVTAKLEYIHYDLEDRTVTATHAAFPGQHMSYDFSNSGDIFKAGLNFKF